MKAVYMQQLHFLTRIYGKRIVNVPYIDLLTEWTNMETINFNESHALLTFHVALKPYLHSVASIFDTITYQDNYFHSAWHFCNQKSS
jgi:aminopeptidase-like protein